MRKVILLGDSICGGYQPVVERILAGAFEVWRPKLQPGTTAATSNGTTTFVLSRLDDWAINRPADVIHLNCGLHDIVLEKDGHHWVDIEAYAANVRRILQRLKNETKARIIWATTTPIIEERLVAYVRREEDVRRYNAVAVQAAKEQGAEVNDLCAVVMKAGKERCICPDGVHMVDFGNELLGEAVAHVLSSEMNAGNATGAKRKGAAVDEA